MGALATSIQDDFDLFDETELVTFRSLQPGGTYSNTANVTALRRVTSVRQVSADGGGEVYAREVVWHLKAKDLAGVECKPNDVVRQASGVEWVAGPDVRLETLGTRWRLGGCTRSASASASAALLLEGGGFLLAEGGGLLLLG